MKFIKVVTCSIFLLFHLSANADMTKDSAIQLLEEYKSAVISRDVDKLASVFSEDASIKFTGYGCNWFCKTHRYIWSKENFRNEAGIWLISSSSKKVDFEYERTRVKISKDKNSATVHAIAVQTKTLGSDSSSLTSATQRFKIKMTLSLVDGKIRVSHANIKQRPKPQRNSIYTFFSWKF